MFGFLKSNKNAKDRYYWYEKAEKIRFKCGKDEDFKEAIKYYKKAISIDPTYEEAWEGQGYAFYRINKFDEAVKCYDKALDIKTGFIFRDKAYWCKKARIRLDKSTKKEHRQEALKLYDKALSSDSNYEEALYGKAEAFCYLRKFDESIRWYDKALEVNAKSTGEDKKYWYKKGKIRLDRGKDKYKYEEAIEYFEKSLSLDKNFYKSWDGKGRAFYLLEKYDESFSCFEKAMEYDNEYYWSTWYDRGNILYKIKEFDKALECYNRVLGIDKGDNTCGWHGKIKVFKALGKYDIAADCYRGLLKYVPLSQKDIMELGDFLYITGNIDEAIDCFNKVLNMTDKAESKSHALTWLGKAFYRKEDYKQSLNYFDKALKINSNSEFFNLNLSTGIIWTLKSKSLKKLGKHREEKKSVSEALKWFDKAIKEYSASPEGYFCLKGEVFYEKGRALFELERKEEAVNSYKKSLEYYNKALNKSADYVDAWPGKANVLFELEDCDEAVKTCRVGLEHHPALVELKLLLKKWEEKNKISPPEDKESNLKDGIKLIEKGKFKPAIRYFDKILSEKPSSVPALYYKGTAVYFRGDSMGAVEIFERALEISPEDEHIWIGKGKALYMYGNREEALKCFDKALEINPDNLHSLYKKILTLKLLGREKEAKKCNEKLLKSGPDFEYPEDPLKYWYHDWIILMP